MVAAAIVAARASRRWTWPLMEAANRNSQRVRDGDRSIEPSRSPFVATWNTAAKLNVAFSGKTSCRI